MKFARLIKIFFVDNLPKLETFSNSLTFFQTLHTCCIFDYYSVKYSSCIFDSLSIMAYIFRILFDDCMSYSKWWPITIDASVIIDKTFILLYKKQNSLTQSV
jgi:hypothetical protein